MHQATKTGKPDVGSIGLPSGDNGRAPVYASNSTTYGRNGQTDPITEFVASATVAPCVVTIPAEPEFGPVADPADEDAPLTHMQRLIASMPLELRAAFGAESKPSDAPTWADMAGVIGPIKWEWSPWLPSGLLALLVSQAGDGKSSLVLRIVATYLLGWMWPDGTPFEGETGKVLWCEAEAGQAMNLDRAKAWGLPLDAILAPLTNPLDDVCLTDTEHLASIDAKARRDDVRLIVVDSLSGATGGKTSSEDMMPVVKWLAELARDTGKPVILLHHLRKRGLSDVSDVVTLDRVRDSSAIVQPARVVWAIDTPDAQHAEHKRLSIIKSNLARAPKPIGLRIADDGVAFDEAPQTPKSMTKLDQAKLLLLRILAAGPMLATDIEKEAILDGISMDTMRAAQKKLGLNTSKDGHTGRWSWSLPEVKNWQDGAR